MFKSVTVKLSSSLTDFVPESQPQENTVMTLMDFVEPTMETEWMTYALQIKKSSETQNTLLLHGLYLMIHAQLMSRVLVNKQ